MDFATLWVFGEGVKSARGATAILAVAATFEICLERTFTRAIANELLQTNYCTRNNRKSAIVCQPLQISASHELLHEPLR